MATRKRAVAPSWIAVDWGAQGMRAWALDDHDRILMKARSAQGLAQLATDAFEPVLIRLIAPWLINPQTPVIISGIGDLPALAPVVPPAYLPCRPTEVTPVPVNVQDPRIKLFALPGLRQAHSPHGPGAIEGLIRGLIAEMPGFDGVVCVSGAVSRWIRLARGKVLSFQGFVSGELVSLISGHPSLKPTLSGSDVDLSAFDATLETVVGTPSDAASQTYRLWSDAASPDTDGAVSKGRLAGLCIGMELAAAQPIREGLPVVVANQGSHADLYARAVRLLGGEVQTHAAEELTLAGLQQAFRGLSDPVI